MSTLGVRDCTPTRLSTLIQAEHGDSLNKTITLDVGGLEHKAWRTWSNRFSRSYVHLTLTVPRYIREGETRTPFGTHTYHFRSPASGDSIEDWKPTE